MRVCAVIVVDARVREHRPNGSLLLDRFCVEQFYFSANKTYRVVGVKNRRLQFDCRSSIPLGGRVHLDLSSGRSFRRSRSSLGRFREGRPQRYLSVGAPPSVPRPWRYPEGKGTGGSVGR